MKEMRTTLGLALALSVAHPLPGTPVTRAQLVSMVKSHVDATIIRAIIDRDCIDFDVDATNVEELSASVPEDILEAAIRCRGMAGLPIAKASEDPRGPASSVSVADNARRDGASAGASPAAELTVAAEFIGENRALSCSCHLDGALVANLAKPEQGEFGQAVARDRIGKRSDPIRVPPGKQRLLFRCDPAGQEIHVDLDLSPGERRTVEIRESALRRWKLKKNAAISR